MTRAQLLKAFPQASEAFLRENADDYGISQKTILRPRVSPPAPKPLPAKQNDSTGLLGAKNGQSTKLYEASPECFLPNPISEHHQAQPLGGPAPGEQEGDGRTLVSFTGYRVRPLDPDNFAGSVKALLDGLRYAGLISGDEPWKIRLQTDQVKVSKFSEEKTVISIVEP